MNLAPDYWLGWVHILHFFYLALTSLNHVTSTTTLTAVSLKFLEKLGWVMFKELTAEVYYTVESRVRAM